jgi:putative endonuclease
LKKGYTYIMASERNGTIYTGVTSDLMKRVYQHKNKLIEGFTAKYSVNNLVFFEEYSNIIDAISREKQIKGMSRKKKLALIETNNKTWKDLSESWFKDS